jgi:hypothetical protein
VKKYVQFSQMVREEDYNKYMELFHMGFIVTSKLMNFDGDPVLINGEQIVITKHFNMIESVNLLNYIMNFNVDGLHFRDADCGFEHSISYEPV